MHVTFLLTFLLPLFVVGARAPFESGIPNNQFKSGIPIDLLEQPLALGQKLAKTFIKKIVLLPNVLRVRGAVSNESAVAYYLTGFDNAGRPVWVLNLANWRNPRLGQRERRTAVQAFTKKRVLDFSTDLAESFKMAAERAEKQGKSVPVKKFGAIIDGKNLGLDFVQKLGYIGRFTFLWAMSYNSLLDYGYIVNMDPMLILILKSLLTFAPGMFSKFRLFTDKNNFVPTLLTLIPKDQLPPSLGGERGHTNLISSLNQPLSNATVLEPIKKKPNFLPDLLSKLLQQLHLIPEKHSTQ